MQRLEKFLFDNHINYIKSFDCVLIYNSFLHEYLVIYKDVNEYEDYLYSYFRSYDINKISVVNYAYLVNIYIRNFLLER